MQLNSTTRATAHLPKRFVVQKVVFEEREVRHADVDHRQEWICPSAPVLGDNNVTAPRLFLVETTSLDFPDRFVDGKGGSGTRDHGVENYVWIGKGFGHPVQRIHKLMTRLVSHSISRSQEFYIHLPSLRSLVHIIRDTVHMRRDM